MKTGTFYGFTCANHSEEPAWFYHYKSAVNFHSACGFGDDCVIETAETVDDKSVLDTPGRVWVKEPVKDSPIDQLPVELCETIIRDMDMVDMTTRDMVTVWRLGSMIWLHSQRLGAEYPKE